MEWPKTHKTVVRWLDMGAAEMTLNCVLLTVNGKAGDWKEYKYCIGWYRESESERELSGVFGRESPAVVNIISAACRQPLHVALIPQ